MRFSMSRHSHSDTLRLILAKELLGHTFSVDRDTVNYTAMLLAFCKDEDPREGLGKAFTLAIGNRVCIDTAEGERYAQELVKHRAKHLGLTHLPNEATEVNGDTRVEIFAYLHSPGLACGVCNKIVGFPDSSGYYELHNKQSGKGRGYT